MKYCNFAFKEHFQKKISVEGCSIKYKINVKLRHTRLIRFVASTCLSVYYHT